MSANGHSSSQPMATRNSRLKINVSDLNTTTSPHSPKLRGSTQLPSVALGQIQELMSVIVTRLDKVEQNQQHLIQEIAELKEISRTITNPHQSQGGEVVVQNTDLLEQIKAISDHVLSDKRKQLLKDKCQKIKATFSMKWKNTLNSRRQAYFNYLRNSEKAELYSSWSEDSPNYLPLHLRPKIQSNERQDIIDTKVGEAKVKFNNAITTMKNSAEINRGKFNSYDSEMTVLIQNKTENDEACRLMLTEWWQRDCTEAENVSQEKWSNKKDFLNQKKNETTESGENATYKLIETITDQSNTPQNEQARSENRPQQRQRNQIQRQRQQSNNRNQNNQRQQGNQPRRKYPQRRNIEVEGNNQYQQNNQQRMPHYSNPGQTLRPQNPPNQRNYQGSNGNRQSWISSPPHQTYSAVTSHSPPTTSHATIPFLVNLLQQMTQPPDQLHGNSVFQ